MIRLNQRASRIVDPLTADAEAFGVESQQIGGATVVDCGVASRGGLEAGRLMALAAMAGLGEIALHPNHHLPGTGVSVAVRTDQPLRACLASQYAGWPLQVGDYFAMASGPMRLLRGREELLTELGERPDESAAVGVLETARIPTADVVEAVAADCGIEPHNITLLVAPTRSIAGTLQIVARSVETALHKLHELTREIDFELNRVVSASGSAPMPPPSRDDVTAIGRTNDAILYGARVSLWINADDDFLASLARRLPSSASADYGKPFAEILRRANGDFYGIDPMLFSPATVSIISTQSGHVFSGGDVATDLLRVSFESDA